MTAEDIIAFNTNHNTPSELMKATQELSVNQVKTLALDLVWNMCVRRKRLDAKRAILDAKMRPV